LQTIWQFQTASFDGVICLSVLEYLDNPERCVEELFRVLRPGAQLVISVPNRHSLVRQLQRALIVGFGIFQKSYLNVSTRAWTAGELKNMGEKHRMADVTISSFDPIISTSLFGVIPPSLYFLVARKIE
jgi:2-polyprenyl-3-methyl-5-hydroxy-6-metoxy-1,4-benzoquinol methylase